MCNCTPNIRTMWCGKGDCTPPEQIRNSTLNELMLCQKAFNEQQDKYEKLLEFVKKVKSQPCCMICNCLSCDAEKILREMGEA